ncbi:MAG: hypothetical protein ACRD2C_04685 [Acidimicrobiales bacterium]
MVTVKSTEAGESAVQSMLSILQGQWDETAASFKSQGDILANPENFDGPSAGRYREQWEPLKTNLQNILSELTELSTNLQNINTEIQRAGGNTG